MDLDANGQPKQQGCHNCGIIGHHSHVCTNPKVEGADPRSQVGKAHLI